MNLQKFNPQMPSGIPTWDTVKFWANLAAKFTHASVAAQVMAGFALLELHRQHGVRRGNPHLGKKPNDSQFPHACGNCHDGKSWDVVVREFAPVSEDTAGRWMKMAGVVKAKWKKLAPEDRLKELMAVPPSQWSDTDTKLVCDALHKATDELTQSEFMIELGLQKVPQGAHGGNPNAHGKRALSAAEKAQKLAEYANDQTKALQEIIFTLGLKWAALPDEDLHATVHYLDGLSKLMKSWTATPTPKRDLEELEKLWNKHFKP